MGISKTRQKLVDVARQLFAKYGKDNVTMNDISTSSGKGRRTLYTYFKNKNEIYLAVIEKEIALLQEKLQNVLDKDLPPDKKIVEYLMVHLQGAKEALTRNGSLRADFFKDIYEVEHARRRIDVWETQRLTEIIQQGIDDGIFNCKNPKVSAIVLFYSLKGMEQAYFRNRISEKIDLYRNDIIRIMFNGIQK